MRRETRDSVTGRLVHRQGSDDARGALRLLGAYGACVAPRIPTFCDRTCIDRFRATPAPSPAERRGRRSRRRAAVTRNAALAPAAARGELASCPRRTGRGPPARVRSLAPRAAYRRAAREDQAGGCGTCARSCLILI